MCFCIGKLRERVWCGDHFYRYTCEKCSKNGTEHFERIQLSWCALIQLCMYNLLKMTDADGRIAGEVPLELQFFPYPVSLDGNNEAPGSLAAKVNLSEFSFSKRSASSTAYQTSSPEAILQQRRAGFYRWREDICRVIDESWPHLTCSNRPRTASWQNSVSSILSANPHLFVSGQLVVRQSGWWALKHPYPPIPEGKDVDVSAEVITLPNEAAVRDEPASLKAALLAKLQGIDKDLLRQALQQSKRTVASLQKAQAKGSQKPNELPKPTKPLPSPVTKTTRKTVVKEENGKTKLLKKRKRPDQPETKETTTIDSKKPEQQITMAENEEIKHLDAIIKMCEEALLDCPDAPEMRRRRRLSLARKVKLNKRISHIFGSNFVHA